MALSLLSRAWRGSLLTKGLSTPLVTQAVRCASSVLKYEGIEIERTRNPQNKPWTDKPDPQALQFGRNFSDHMLLVNWAKDQGWDPPRIVPFGDIPFSPAVSCFHYATECFEGMKAYYCEDGKIRLFRPMENMKRMNRSAVAASLPEFDGEAFLDCIKELIRVDSDWVPKSQECSLYVRPTFIGTEPFIGVHASSTALLYCITGPVGPYFSSGTFEPVSLYADPQFIRAWPGGVGDSKMGGNYGPTIRIQKIAESKGCSQVLWLLGEDHQLTEVGTMNIFVHWINEDGDPEIATPPLSGTILPGVTRKSLLELGATWGSHKVVERNINMADVQKANKENRLKEIFGAGTACVVCPVNKILFLDQNISIPTMETGAEVAHRFYNDLTDIQYGRVKHEWSVVVD